MRRLLADPAHEIRRGDRILEAAVGKGFRHELHRGDRCAQLVRYVTDKVAPNSLEMMDASLVAYQQDCRDLALERNRPCNEVAIVELDRALLDATALARRLDHADEPVVNLAGDECRSLIEIETEQAARGFVGEQHAAVGVEADDPGIEQEADRAQHRHAVSTGVQIAHADHLHPIEYRDRAKAACAATRSAQRRDCSRRH